MVDVDGIHRGVVSGLLSRLWDISYRTGQRELVGALAQCAAGVHAGDLDCPLGAVVLEEYAAQHGRPVHPGAPLDPTGLGLAIDALMEGRASALGDPVMLPAVIQCERTRRMGRRCPVYRAASSRAAASRIARTSRVS